MTHPLPKASTTWLGIWPGSPLLVPAEPRFRSRNARTWSTPMAGRSELPSGKPSSFRRTELRLGEPEPPAKKRIIDVAVLVEPCQLARVSGYRASVRCSLSGVFSESGRCASAGLRAQPCRSPAPRPTLAGMASYGLSAGLGGSASRTRGTQECSPRLFTRAEEHTQRFRLGLRDFHAAPAFAADSLKVGLRRSRRSVSSAR